MSFELKAHAASLLNHAKQHYLQDLDVLSEEQLTTSPGGTARTPIDFTYEVIVVNNMAAARIRGEDPGPWPFGDGWAVAPDDYRSKAKIRESLEASIDALTALIGDDPLRPVTLSDGSQSTVYERLSFCALHTMYHDAQLNYIQSLAGDAEVHWS